jgi:Galactose oxidase, central domain
MCSILFQLVSAPRVLAQNFVLTGSLNTARIQHTATLLNNGTVLMAGGQTNGGAVLASAELYNPATGTFALTGGLNTARSLATATLLNDGMVLVAGGSDAPGSPVASAELYEPSTVVPPPTSESITPPLSPTGPNQFRFDNNVHNFTVQYPAGTSFSGVNMTVTAVQIPQASFQERVAGTAFATALCIAYEGENGYCEDYQVTCTNTSGSSVTCPSESTPSISVKTCYDTQRAIINPGFLTAPIGTNNWTNIFTAFYLQRIDPTTRGRTTGFSEFVAVSLGASDAQGAGQFIPLGEAQ